MKTERYHKVNTSQEPLQNISLDLGPSIEQKGSCLLKSLYCGCVKSSGELSINVESVSI